MGECEKRKVGEQGKVILPRELCEQLGIRGGDVLVVQREGSKIVIEKSVTHEDLAEGYSQWTNRSHELADEWQGTSREANEYLGDVPNW